jgi:hypothetical protein
LAVTAFECAKSEFWWHREKNETHKEKCRKEKKDQLFSLTLLDIRLSFRALPLTLSLSPPNLTSSLHHVRDSKEEEARLPHMSLDKMEEE